MNENSDHIVLSIGLLVSNQKHTIQKCLDSLRPIREAIPCQLIITDTGCDEAAQPLLASCADVLHTFSWCNDFAKARNANLSHATGEWYMYLDDDEWFIDTAELIDFFVSGSYREFDGACYQIRNYQNESGSMYTDDYLSRMIRLTPKRQFTGRIHEYLTPIPEKNCLLGSLVEHYGYVFRTPEELQAHYERNHTLLIKMREEEPTNQRWWTHLAQEYLSTRDAERLRKLGEDGLQLVEGLDDVTSMLNRGTFYMCNIVASECEHDDERELKECERALADTRNTRLCIAFTKWWKAHCELRMGNYSSAEECLNDYLRDYQYFLKNEEEHIAQRTPLIVGQCYDDIKVKEAYEMLIEVGLRQGRTEYLNRYLDKLQWDIEGAFIYGNLMDAIVGALVTIKQRKLFIRTLRVIRANVEVWEAFCREIVVWSEEERPQLDRALRLCRELGFERGITEMLAWHRLESMLRSAMPIMSYPEYKAWFVEWAEHVLGFYSDAYGKTFEEQTELPGVCLMAMMIQDAMNAENDKERFLAVMRQCPEVYPTLKNQVTTLLVLYVQEPQRKAREAKERLREMKVKVLDQVNRLTADGQYDQALQVLDELKKIVPDDMEIASIGLKVCMQKVEQ